MLDAAGDVRSTVLRVETIEQLAMPRKTADSLKRAYRLTIPQR
jgi:hypothetical protein